MDGPFTPAPREYHMLYGLTPERLARARPDALVLHPGPLNRGFEITNAVAYDPVRSAITEQVEMGVAVRLACLDVLTRSASGVEGLAGWEGPTSDFQSQLSTTYPVFSLKKKP